MTVVVGAGWMDDERDDTCYCDECDCADKASEPTDEVIDRMLTDEKFYDNIVGWF